MAEGGEEEELDNPFSFKKYVKKKSQPRNEDDADKEDIFSVSGSTSSRKKEKLSLVVAQDCDIDASTGAKKKTSKDNPFSFKKFLGQQGEESTSRRGLSLPEPAENGVVFPGRLSPSFDAASSLLSPVWEPNLVHQGNVQPPDFASDLPDFIQNHFTEEQLHEKSQRSLLPDFTLQSQGTRERVGASFANSDNRGSRVPVLHNFENSFNPDDGFSDDEESVQQGRQMDGLSLPDFLVDSAVPIVVQGQADVTPVASTRNHTGASGVRFSELPPLDQSAAGIRSNRAGDASEECIHQLREENSHLRMQFAQMQQRRREEDERVAELEKELSRLRKKEAEETAVMERAVQQVEENLVATTTRAVQAETLVAKLKQEIRALQAKLKSVTAENEALKSGDKGLSDLRERTKYASEQLTSAAVTAEHNLRELLSGVEKLRLLGHVLDSFEKVTDAEETPSQENSNKPT